MRLPFTDAQFLDVFAGYNSALWPVVAALWFTTLGVSVALVRRRVSSRALCAFVALHWAWEAVTYHAVFLTRINPAAWIFAALFLVQALAFVWFGVFRTHIRFDWGRTPRHVVAAALMAYSLVYPLLVRWSGFEWPRAPLFAVPCPTMLFTAGIVIAAIPPVPKPLFVVPILWSVVGGSAALLLGMTPDLMLLGAGALLLFSVASPSSRALTQRG